MPKRRGIALSGIVLSENIRLEIRLRVAEAEKVTIDSAGIKTIIIFKSGHARKAERSSENGITRWRKTRKSDGRDLHEERVGS